jgi:tetratricopeptide (TPR) repeat protein
MDRPGMSKASPSRRGLLPLIPILTLALAATAWSALASEPRAERIMPTGGGSGLGLSPSAQERGPGPAATVVRPEAAADPSRLHSLGRMLIQQARETGDPSVLGQAEEAYRQLVALDPDDVEATVGLGSIALSRHEFSEALELGSAAEALAPGTARPLGIQFDALVELGRYEEAGTILERMLRARPDLASYARLSYYHELHGRLDDAIDAMERAVTAGAGAVENTEYARVLLADLWLLAGDRDRASSLYQTALRVMPGSVPALRGLARVAVASGDLDEAVAHLEAAAERTPLPDVLIALGEAQEAAGRGDDAAATYRLVGEIEGLYRAAGVAAEPAQAVFEADHGDPAIALDLAETAYQATPSIRAADALGWALYRAGRPEAAIEHARDSVRTGTLEPSFHYHLGIIAAALGHEDEAVEALRVSVASGTGWSALHGTRAADLLGSLS